MGVMPHYYEDKYLLVEYMTNVALVAHLNCLQMLGLHDLESLKRWVQEGRCATLAFCCSEK
jgi:hypothetical protein